MSRHLQPASPALDKPAPQTGLTPPLRPTSVQTTPQTRPRLNRRASKTLDLKYGGGGVGRLLLRFATVLLLLAATVASAQPHSPQINKKEKSAPENVEWIWQYTPDAENKDGRENDLVQDLHFRPFLDQFFTAPQTFWGTPIDGRPRTLATTVLDHLSVPDKVLADDNRYVSISGCVVHFCPARGLLWIDLNGSHHLVVFAAIDWTKESRPTTDPAAEYTLWVFPNEPLSIASTGAHPPPALTKSIARWAAEPLPGSGIVQNITHAILVDPDGTPHEVLPSALGVASPGSHSNTDTEAAPLKPRN